MVNMIVSATSVFACTTTDITNNITTWKGGHKGNFETIIDDLVIVGT